jgi:pyridoxamine-phosphate oxidase
MLLLRQTFSSHLPTFRALNSLLTAHRFIMDAVISQPSPDQLKVLPHHQYITKDHISPLTVAPSPLDQFRTWFKEAVDGGVVQEPEAMSLSTATPSGIPSARIVLFKQLDPHGFVFFTNYTSRKSQELLRNPNAALVFYWREVHRSVRVLGRVEKVSKEESEEYYHSRPVGSQLGAWASRQSTVVEEGEVNARLHKLEERFGADVPLPEFWGGWRVVPKCVPYFRWFASLTEAPSVKWNSGPENHLACTIAFDTSESKDLQTTTLNGR